jgi:hypothetical protein
MHSLREGMKKQQALPVASLKMVHEVQATCVPDRLRPTRVAEKRPLCRYYAMAIKIYPLADKFLFSYKGTGRGDLFLLREATAHYK